MSDPVLGWAECNRCGLRQVIRYGADGEPVPGQRCQACTPPAPESTPAPPQQPESPPPDPPALPPAEAAPPDPHRERMRELGRRGGLARARNQTAEERSAHSRHAAHCFWGRSRPRIPPPRCLPGS